MGALEGGKLTRDLDPKTLLGIFWCFSPGTSTRPTATCFDNRPPKLVGCFAYYKPLTYPIALGGVMDLTRYHVVL